MLNDRENNLCEQFAIGLFFSEVPEGTTMANLAGRLEADENEIDGNQAFVVWQPFEDYPMAWVLEQISQTDANLKRLVATRLAQGVMLENRPEECKPILQSKFDDWPSDTNAEIEAVTRTHYGTGLMFYFAQSLNMPIDTELLKVIQSFKFTYQAKDDWYDFAWLVTKAGFDVFLSDDDESEGCIEIYQRELVT